VVPGWVTVVPGWVTVVPGWVTVVPGWVTVVPGWVTVWPGWVTVTGTCWDGPGWLFPFWVAQQSRLRTEVRVEAAPLGSVAERTAVSGQLASEISQEVWYVSWNSGLSA